MDSVAEPTLITTRETRKLYPMRIAYTLLLLVGTLALQGCFGCGQCAFHSVIVQVTASDGSILDDVTGRVEGGNPLHCESTSSTSWACDTFDNDLGAGTFTLVIEAPGFSSESIFLPPLPETTDGCDCRTMNLNESVVLNPNP